MSQKFVEIMEWTCKKCGKTYERYVPRMQEFEFGKTFYCIGCETELKFSELQVEKEEVDDQYFCPHCTGTDFNISRPKKPE